MTKDIDLVERTREEQVQALRERFEELQHACKLYDQGRLAEAPRLGALAFLLAVDKGQQSILTQLGRGSIGFMDTRPPVIGNLPRRGLQLIRVTFYDDRWAMEPALNDRGLPEMQKRSQWLSRIVLSDDNKRDYKTLDIIEFYRHKQGGGHYDRRIEVGFAKLLRDGTIGIKLTRNTDNHDLPLTIGPLPATMRQIAYELMLTIQVGCTDLLGDFHPTARFK